jgi:DNA-binding CsgD family transcriptional regulator
MEERIPYDTDEELAVRLFGPGAKPLPGFSDAARAALGELRPRDRSVFLQCLEGKTLEEIGRGLGITRERVRQIKERATRYLRRRTVTYVAVPKEELSPPPLSVDDIERLLGQAFRDQRNAWREFRDSFSPEQTKLWQEYWLLGSRARRGENSKEQRSLVWEKFTNSLTNKQRELWRAYRRASAYTRKVRAALQRAREGRGVCAI